MTQPEATDTLDSPSHSMLHRAQFNVRAFGATGDGVTDDTAEIQAAVDALGTVGGTLLFPPGTYLVSSPGIVLPTSTGGADHVTMRVSGYGATIKATTAISMMKRETPANQTAANNMANYRFVIEGLRFQGSSTSGQIGLDLIASYGAIVRDCTFLQCDTGLKITFGLMNLVEGCFEKTCVSYGFVATAGDGIWGGSSGSNGTVFRSCRSYGSTGELAQFYAYGSSGIKFENCITEGLNPVNGIEYDYGGATTAKDVSVDGLHSENSPTNAVMKFNLYGGFAIVDRVWHQPLNCTLIHGTGTSAAIHVRGIAYWPGGTKLKHGDASTVFGYPFWVFDHGVGNSNGVDVDLESSTHWVSGIVPSYSTWNRTTASANHGIRPAQRALELSGHLTQTLAGSMHEFLENGTADIGAGSANTARLYCRDNGAGKTQLCVRFATGAVQVLATQP